MLQPRLKQVERHCVGLAIEKAMERLIENWLISSDLRKKRQA